MEFDERISRAVDNFMQGYNCAQSVFMAFADLYGLSREQALHVSASFGGGIGRMRLTCGAACALFMLAGMETCALSGPDRESKRANYALVQQLAADFKARTGSLTCSELLGLRRNGHTDPTPQARDAHYYATRPCAGMVETAARIWAEHLGSRPVPETPTAKTPCQ